jgi:hypothetical protein
MFTVELTAGAVFGLGVVIGVILGIILISILAVTITKK